MANQYFIFKQFTVFQERCAMKIGTDGVLLGAWADFGEAETMLDIGTGTGIIAIMAAQRSKAKIHAIEIDSDAYRQAKENMAQCPWRERLEIQHISLQDFALSTQNTFDHIVSNPPYFAHSLKAPDKKRSLARHNDSLPFNELIHSVEKLLSRQGKFSLILPYQQEKNCIELTRSHSLFCNRKLFVLPNPQKAPKRVLLEFSRSEKECRKETIIIEKKRHEYTEDYRRLTKDFYPAF